MQIFFFKNVDIQLILEIKISFVIYHPIDPKILKGLFCLGHPVYRIYFTSIRSFRNSNML